MSKQSGFTAFEMLVALWGLFCIAGAALTVWAIVHFAGKYW